MVNLFFILDTVIGLNNYNTHEKIKQTNSVKNIGEKIKK